MNKEINEAQEPSAIHLHDSRFMRSVYLTVGFAALALAVAGALLPVLPTTPFLLLAAACFARSSKRFHDKLLANRIAGPIIREWTAHRSIRREVKRWVYVLMALSFGSSIMVMPTLWLQVMLAVLGIVLTFFIWRIPVRDSTSDS
ncbi:MAG TPA: YbaN family protein [Nitrosospira sp.]|nr:YbaN family protein [Nitrosospira sp.]